MKAITVALVGSLAYIVAFGVAAYYTKSDLSLMLAGAAMFIAMHAHTRWWG